MKVRIVIYIPDLLKNLIEKEAKREGKILQRVALEALNANVKKPSKKAKEYLEELHKGTNFYDMEDKRNNKIEINVEKGFISPYILKRFYDENLGLKKGQARLNGVMTEAYKKSFRYFYITQIAKYYIKDEEKRTVNNYFKKFFNGV